MTTKKTDSTTSGFEDWATAQSVRLAEELTRQGFEAGVLEKGQIVICKIKLSKPKVSVHKKERVFSVELSAADKEKILSMSWGPTIGSMVRDLVSKTKRLKNPIAGKDQWSCSPAYHPTINKMFRVAGLPWRLVEYEEQGIRFMHLGTMIEKGAEIGTIRFFPSSR